MFTGSSSQEETLPRDGSAPKKATTYLSTFESAVGRDRAWKNGVAIDYAAGLALHHQTAFWGVVWDNYGTNQAFLVEVFKDCTVDRMVAAGVPEVMRLRIENTLLRQAAATSRAAADESMYRNLTCGGRPPHDYGQCPSCR